MGLLEGFGGREEEGRGTFAIPRQVLVAVDAPAVVEANVHPVLELEPVPAAEAVKGVVPAEFVGAPDLSAADPGHDAVAAVDFLAQLDLRLDKSFVAVAPFVVAAHAFHAAHLGVHVPRRGAGREVGVEVVGEDGAFPEFLVEVEGQGEASEAAARIAQPFGIPLGFGLDEDALRGVERHVARVVLGEEAEAGVEGVGGVARFGNVVREGILLGRVVASLLPEGVEFAHPAARNRFTGLCVGLDVVHIGDHARVFVLRPGVVDAPADADVKASGERRAVGDAEDAHRGGEFLCIALCAGIVAHAVECTRKVDEGPGVAQALFVVVEDVVAREAEQDEFFGREVAVNRDVRRGGHGVRAVYPVKPRYEESDSEADIRRVVRAGGDAPVDFLFERTVDVRTAVIVDDAAYEAFALGGRCEGCGVGGLFGGAGCGASDLGQGFLGRGKGIHVLVGLLPYGGICYQQHADR